MIALDTNVWIRYIVQDDEQQALLATYLIETQCTIENPAFINEITLCEIIWVLKRAYRYEKSVISTILQQLLNTDEIYISSYNEAQKAYHDYVIGNADFSDYFIARLNEKIGCSYTFSFDKKACQHESFKLLSSSSLNT